MALSEKEWLERRKNLCNRCAKATYCRAGKSHGFNTEACRFWEIGAPIGDDFGAIREDFRDAAEFEARVAERLAERAFRLSDERDISGAVLYPARLDILPRLKSGEDVKMKGSAAWHGTS